MSGMFGLERTNHDFSERRSWGKNIFTNTWPVALAQYMSLSLDENPVLILAKFEEDGTLTTTHAYRPWSEIILTDPTSARFLFEAPFDGYREFTQVTPEKSDVVIADANNVHRRALEIKLTAVPDSTTKSRARDGQACELVFRPTTIEQLAYSLCESFGLDGRQELNELILERITSPQQFNWRDEQFVLNHLDEIEAAMLSIIAARSEAQTPLLLHCIWRSIGSSPLLDEECFDIFVWSNLALLSVFLNSSMSSRSGQINRPQRSIVWLVKLLYDYSTQRHLARLDTFRDITYGNQTDKAGAFAGNVTLDYLRGEALTHPRIHRSKVKDVITGRGLDYLAPERRLDAAMYFNAKMSES